MKFLRPLCGLVFSLAAHAGCEEMLATSHTFLPANTGRFLIGVLVEMPPYRTPVLAVSRYLGRHADLICGLQQMYHTIEVRWAGELYVRNNGPEPAFAKIEVANETSGLVHGHEGQVLNMHCRDGKFPVRIAANNAKELLRLNPALFASTFHTFTYEESEHLLKALPGGGNFRHQLGNSLGWLSIVLCMGGRTLLSEGGQLKMRESQRKNIEDILLAVSVLDVSNAHAPEMRELGRKLRLMLTGTLPPDLENFRHLLGLFIDVLDTTEDWATL